MAAVTVQFVPDDPDMVITLDLPAGGATIQWVKRELCKQDPTGGSAPDSFCLLAAGRLGTVLDDSTAITAELTHLVLRTGDAEVGEHAHFSELAEHTAEDTVDNDDVVEAEPWECISPKTNSGPQLWDVVGGAEKGGILVREGQEISSAQNPLRLSVGAVIQEIELIGDRLRFELVVGAGPASGWVSTTLRAKALVVRREETTLEVPRDHTERLSPDQESIRRAESGKAILRAAGEPCRVLGLQAGASSKMVRRAYHKLALLHHPDKAGSDEVFRVIHAAYDALSSDLTAAQGHDGSCGWSDLEGQAVGPFQAHTFGNKCNVVLFDCFGAPPWESRRLYTGAWHEGKVRCWELSQQLDGARPPPRLLGEIDVDGYLNDMVAISPHGLLTAQSAGFDPPPGTSMRAYNLFQTPLQAPTRDSAVKKSLEDGSEGDQQQLVVKSDVPSGTSVMDDPGSDGSRLIFLHERGARAIALWPRPNSRDAAPYLVGSVSKDAIGVSQICSDGSSLSSPLWRCQNPHNEKPQELTQKISTLCWQNRGQIWSGGTDGLVKLWDVEGGRQEATITVKTSVVEVIETWDGPGMLVAGGTAGLVYLDARVGSIVRSQETRCAVCALRVLHGDHPMLFMGVGNDLVQYDTRMFAEGKDAKFTGVGSWTLKSRVTAINCTTSMQDHLLVAIGTDNGMVAAFDTS